MNTSLKRKYQETKEQELATEINYVSQKEKLEEEIDTLKAQLIAKPQSLLAKRQDSVRSSAEGKLLEGETKNLEACTNLNKKSEEELRSPVIP